MVIHSIFMLHIVQSSVCLTGSSLSDRFIIIVLMPIKMSVFEKSEAKHFEGKKTKQNL